MRSIVLILLAIGTLLLRAGFALQASGSVRAKNSAGMFVRTLADTAAAAFAFWAFGAGLLFQTRFTWLGFDKNFIFREPPEFAATEFFHLSLCIISSAIVTGALAERSKFYASVIVSFVLGGFVFPIIGHWIWFGQLHEWNFVDFGGATAIHLSGAIFGAIGIALLGSRRGKYNADRSSNSIAGHSLPMLGAGMLLLFVGWLPYLVGCVWSHWTPASSLDEVIVSICTTNILLAGVGGVAGGLFYSHHCYRKPDLFFTFSGLLAGLVAISAGLAAVNNIEAMLIGVIAGVLAPLVATQLDVRARMDDPLGLVAIHGGGAIWGVLATAIFIRTSDPMDHLRLLAVQAGGLAAVIALCAAIATPLFIVLKMLGLLRLSTADEESGTDIADHGVEAYPEFSASKSE